MSKHSYSNISDPFKIEVGIHYATHLPDQINLESKSIILEKRTKNGLTEISLGSESGGIWIPSFIVRTRLIIVLIIILNYYVKLVSSIKIRLFSIEHRNM